MYFKDNLFLFQNSRKSKFELKSLTRGERWNLIANSRGELVKWVDCLIERGAKVFNLKYYFK